MLNVGIIFLVNIRNKRVGLIIILELVIASYFVIGADWAGHDFNLMFNSYFADIFLPFGFYFLLHLFGDKYNYFDKWWKKAILIFVLVSLSETLQYFGIYALATVFDPLDYLMYAIGVLLASFVDRKILVKRFSYW